MRNVARTNDRIEITNGNEILSTNIVGDPRKSAAGDSFGRCIDTGKFPKFVKTNTKEINVVIGIIINWKRRRTRK
jgi:hypothetical protein